MDIEKYQLRWAAFWLAIAWSLVASVVYLSLAPVAFDVPGPDSDKYGHVIAYGVMMFWFMQIYAARRSRIMIAVGLALLGVGLEILQAYTGYRTFERADMLANVAGVALGWLAGPPRTMNLLLRFEGLRTQ